MHEAEKQQSRAPFISLKKRQSATDEELTEFYEKLHDYYLNLPYDRMMVALEEMNYRDTARHVLEPEQRG